MRERKITNSRNAIGDSNAYKARAIIERRNTDWSNAIWNYNIGERFTFLKRLFTNASNSIGNHYLSFIAFILYKTSVLDFKIRVRLADFFFSDRGSRCGANFRRRSFTGNYFRRLFNHLNGAVIRIPFWIPFFSLLEIININCKAAAILKRPFTNRSNIIGDSNACKARAMREYTPTNRSNTITYVYASETLATRERTITNRSNATRDSYVCEFMAISERIITNRSNALRDSYAFNVSTIPERILTNTSNPIWNHNLRLFALIFFEATINDFKIAVVNNILFLFEPTVERIVVL